MLVIDASAAAPLVLPDESDRLLPIVQTSFEHADVLVPGHWQLEILNLGLVAAKRKRIDLAMFLEALNDLSGYDVRIDQDTSRHSWTYTRHLAVKHGLTAYDAAYLELSLRTGSRLASFDGDLIAAAQAENVDVVR